MAADLPPSMLPLPVPSAAECMDCGVRCCLIATHRISVAPTSISSLLFFSAKRKYALLNGRLPGYSARV